MANTSAWELGWQTGARRQEERRERKQDLADEERRLKVSDLYAKRDALALTVPSLAIGSDEHTKAMSGLADLEGQIAAVYHPLRAPGMLQKDWHWLAGLIHGKTKPTPAVLAKTTEPGEAIEGTEAATLTMPSDTVTLPPSYPEPVHGFVAPKAGVGPPAPSVTTAQPATVKLPSESVTMPATPATTGPMRATVTAQPEAMSRYQREPMARRAEAEKAAEQDVAAAAGLSPEEEMQQQSRKNLAFITQAMKDFKTMKPDATAEEQAAFFNDVVAKQYGFAQSKPAWKEYTAPDGTKQWFDASRPDLIPPGWNATGTESSDTRTRADFAEFKKQHPDYTGTFEQWKTEQTQYGKLAVPTNKDDRYISIEQRRALGQPISADDQAYSAAWQLYVQKRIIDPAQARAAAMGADRYVQAWLPDDPEKVVFMPAWQAQRSGAGSPQSIGFQIDKGITKYMTSGKGAENINYFNTATDHLKLLGEAADALNNGDIQRLNQFGNAFARETGDPAPTNFNAIKSAVAGELSKTFKGTGATDQEIAEINQGINSAESPDQLHGAINYYTRLMDGKINAMRAQYDAAKLGKPAFPENVPAAGPPGAAPKGGGRPPAAAPAGAGAKGSRSVAAAMTYWTSRPQQAQKRFGTSSPTEQQVIQDMQSKGYTPTRP